MTKYTWDIGRSGDKYPGEGAVQQVCGLKVRLGLSFCGSGCVRLYVVLQEAQAAIMRAENVMNSYQMRNEVLIRFWVL